MRALVVLLLTATATLSCASILGISDYEEADCVRDCGGEDARVDAAVDARVDGG